MSRDFFGADSATISEGGAAAQPGPVTGAPQALQAVPNVALPALQPSPAIPAAAVIPPADKAVAKAQADATVATDPGAKHSVELSAAHPNVLGATAAGALAGSFIPGLGTLVGGLIGFASSKYQIAGDPLGTITSKVLGGAKKGWQKLSAPSHLPHIGMTAAPKK